MVKFTFTTMELTSPAQTPEAHHHKFVVAKLGSSKTDIFLKKVGSFERFFTDIMGLLPNDEKEILRKLDVMQYAFIKILFDFLTVQPD